ncbi:MAG: branched-chain amino acid transaminase [Methylococcales bacterium]|nr:branched-chain amino acid transaminase [Methylococcales bacterium]MBT7408585.1 branched-chain amino acid transaminase [Methylococcales bacterium]
MSMEDREGVIWYDGEFVPWKDAKTHVLTHTLHYGMGVFEGLRAYKTEHGCAIFRLQEHTKRLFLSAHILNMKIPYGSDELNTAQIETVKNNKLFEGAYIRPMCFFGAEGLGLRADNLKVHVIIAAWNWGKYFGEEVQSLGLRLKTSSFSRHHVNVTMCKAKANGNYMNSMLALQEATSCGADDALLLDTEGYAAEASGANLFIIRDDIIYTPDLTSALDGITRRTIIELANKNNFKVIEKRLTRDEIYIADEVFLTGSAAEVTPVRELDSRQIGKGKRGPMTEILQTQYFDLVHGKNNQYDDWLTYI